MTIPIGISQTKEAFETAGHLFRAYADYLGLDVEFQGFSKKLDYLPAMYGPPTGTLLMASVGDQVVGVVGLREIPAYRFNPHPEAVFVEYRLDSVTGGDRDESD